MSVQYFLIVLVLFFGSASVAYSREEKPLCPVEQSKNARSEFKRLYVGGLFAEAEKYLAQYIDQCSEGIYRDIRPLSLHYWMTSDLMIAQSKTGHISECLARGLGVVNFWGWGEEVERQRQGEALAAVKFNMGKCRSMLPALHGIGFSAERCPIKQYGEAIAVPQSWGATATEAMCVYLYPGKRLSEEEEMNLHRGADTKSNAPYLVVVKNDGKGGYLEQKILFSKGALSTGELCGSLNIGLGGARDSRMVLLGGGLGYCWPGNASFAIDAVYRMGSVEAVLVNEVLLPTH